MKILAMMIVNWIVRKTAVGAFQTCPQRASRLTTIRLLSTTSDNQGRRIRQRNDDDDDWVASGWDDDGDDDWGAPAPRGNNRSRQESNDYGSSSGGWDDFDPFEKKSDRSGDSYQPRRRQTSPRSGGYRERSDRGRGGGGYRDRSSRGGDGIRKPSRDSFRQRGASRFPKKEKEGKRSINMNALEGAGFVHLYGLSSVLNALKADRRDLETSVEKAVNDWDDNEADEEVEEPKPEAQFRPFLFIQSRGASTRRGQKASSAEEVMELAEARNVPVAEVDKGVLNALSGNRPHQGFVLRCGRLDFEHLSRLPLPGSRAENPSVWLVLDEVVDPQNLGALLRSAYFLGGGHRMGVLVCSKNSAPPSPVVSAASAGALEVLTVHSTSNLPRTLNQAREDGFRVIGASSSVPKTDGEVEPKLYDLQDLTVDGDKPVLLVLGSEGHGLRTLVAKACSEFVRIPAGSGGDDEATGVDSLNVSVTGGILLWQLLNGSRR